MTAKALAHTILEHASCGKAFAGGSMRVSVTLSHHAHHLAYLAHVVCSHI